MNTTSISISSNDDKSKKKRLPMISILVTLKMNAVRKGLGVLESTLGFQPSLRHQKEPLFTLIGNLSP